MNKEKVIFICTGNSCRSQMAEGLLRDSAGDRFEVYSAGTHPSIVHPNAISVMDEIGIDISGHSSDGIKQYLDLGMDIVITVCDNANQSCPTFPGGAEHIHWSIPDPFLGWKLDQSQLVGFRDCRELLKMKLHDFISSDK
ncbi:MAG: arsenate reductase ArsC [Candidatus Marinimicrobia bacterium]|jgi:arsenate reductase (thioredoxin)|nr:arsenate reductase ArsC [Candidatus Neomarinimicrobiota bacterium]MBT3617433.1 arsenate reductase ArsC [Candidatus Neomarinimicrobiota bacterium]MBT3829373.1 arsenate reductase ArsC [Candidatus Neomarinimicrobiota bacterium]MBT3997656.1 arsenate reductase ArsC [Candidatus Neomarinimicrobiota bacterium]MBT4280954.1 arsenate reductase ArsC [Candidatus Neomarinimicrobiota bacterium]